MARLEDLRDVLGESLPAVLENLSEAVLILDHQRTLRFVNDRARRLLGYNESEPLGGRCRLTTRGIDCENACPLTYALESRLDRVDDFSTVYHTRDGRAVSLKVTVIPLSDADGGFRGAVEILRPAEPAPGALLSGRSEAAIALKNRVTEIAASDSHVMLVGDSPACADVARTIHRYSGVAESLFFSWTGAWDDIPPWPPGTMFAASDGVAGLLAKPPPEGWRVIVGVDQHHDVPGDGSFPCEVLELPTARDLHVDIPLIVSAWLRELEPSLTIHPLALDKLTRMARDVGFERIQRVLRGAVGAAGGHLEEHHIPEDGYRAAYVDELLAQDDPLSALERRLLFEVLERSGWKMQEAADRLGISRVTLWRKLKDHGIERPNNHCEK